MKGGERPVRPDHATREPLLYPLESGGGAEGGQTEEAGNAEENVEDLKEKIKELEDALVEHWEYNVKSEEGKASPLKVPAKPIEKEWRDHMVTHTPPTMVQALHYGARSQKIPSCKCSRCG